MNKQLIALIASATSLASALPAFAADPFRCTDLPYLAYEDGPENNQWGKACGAFSFLGTLTDNFISLTMDSNPNGRQFAVYRVGTNLVKSPWPLSRIANAARGIVAAACPGGLTYLTTCPTGCYTPEQQLQFNGAYMSIEQAYQTEAATITSLTADSTPASLDYSEQPVQSYVVGESQEDIYVLRGENGKTLRVTSGHPLVNGEGDVVAAKSLKAGDELLCSDGSLVSLDSVSTQRYSGWVMSVKPVSTDKRENIHVANGYLAGSVRFQGQWASDTTRLTHRDLFDLRGL